MFYYFSDKNINSINKSRATYSPETSNFYNNLPILENDTKNIIVYTDDVEIFRKLIIKENPENPNTEISLKGALQVDENNKESACLRTLV